MSAATALPCALRCARVVSSVLTLYPAKPFRIAIRRVPVRTEGRTEGELLDDLARVALARADGKKHFGEAADWRFTLPRPLRDRAGARAGPPPRRTTAGLVPRRPKLVSAFM